MKLVSFLKDPIRTPLDPDLARLGALLPDGRILDFATADLRFEDLTAVDFIRDIEALGPWIAELLAAPAGLPNAIVSPEHVALLAPVPRPISMRDGYAFRQHVETARRNRGLAMIPEFDLFPVFYFTNHRTVVGPGELRVGRERLDHLDFELEAFVVIGKTVTNPTLEEADDAIFGYGVMNDFSARTLQMEEMKLNLGPAKGKDFATGLGPWLVTKDELRDRLLASPRGNVYSGRMTAHVNGIQVSEGDVSQMNWTFAELVRRAGDGVTLVAGEVIGSGTVGTGCFLELNGSKITSDQWLHPGDTVSLAIEGLGTLTNTIVEDPSR
ncbi:MAG: fumarylacetoacetate hydrolase family protein [Thermoanaerobaculia bacterium]